MLVALHHSILPIGDEVEARWRAFDRNRLAPKQCLGLVCLDRAPSSSTPEGGLPAIRAHTKVSLGDKLSSKPAISALRQPGTKYLTYESRKT
jgi:hypothetical protein